MGGTGGGRATGLRRAVVVFAVGLAAGVASGLLGVGGGLVMVPLMVLLLGVSQHEAHATSLAAIAPIAAAGALVFGSSGRSEPAVALLLGLGSVPGAVLGAELMRRLGERRLRAAFGLFLLVVGALMVVR